MSAEELSGDGTIAVERTSPRNNRQAFLDMIAVSELGRKLLAASDNGYNVIVGSRPGRMILARDYGDHPRVKVQLRQDLWSTAFGRYQILEGVYDYYRKELGLADCGKVSQDRIAIQLLRECRAIESIDGGMIAAAIHACRSRWASLPGAGYGQHENSLAVLLDAYAEAGGALCAADSAKAQKVIKL